MEKSQTLEQALEFGSTQDKTYYGYDITGVFSHADLVANFNGLRFWLALTPNGELGLNDLLQVKNYNLTLNVKMKSGSLLETLIGWITSFMVGKNILIVVIIKV